MGLLSVVLMIAVGIFILALLILITVDAFVAYKFAHKEEDYTDEEERKGNEGGQIKKSKLVGKELDRVAEKMVSDQIRKERMELEKEKIDKKKTRSELKKPSLVNRVIVGTWRKRESKYSCPISKQN